MPHCGSNEGPIGNDAALGGRASASTGGFLFSPGLMPGHALHATGERIHAMSRLTTRWIADWNPEDEKFWNTEGKVIARRNLIWSIVAEHLGFSIWLIWSIVATKLPQAGFHYTTDQLFQLVALPGLIGSI